MILVLIAPKGSYECWGKRRVLIWGPLFTTASGNIEAGKNNLDISSQKNICTGFLYVISEVCEPSEDYFIHFKVVLKQKYPKCLHSHMYSDRLVMLQ